MFTLCLLFTRLQSREHNNYLVFNWTTKVNWGIKSMYVFSCAIIQFVLLNVGSFTSCGPVASIEARAYPLPTIDIFSRGKNSESAASIWNAKLVLSCCRFAKRKLDESVFLGNRLQVTYAPQFESPLDTKEKLEARRKEVLGRIKCVPPLNLLVSTAMYLVFWHITTVSIANLFTLVILIEIFSSISSICWQTWRDISVFSSSGII